MAATLSVSVDLALAAQGAFDALVDELGFALEARSVSLASGPGGQLSEGGAEIGRIVGWEPGRRIALELTPTAWGGPRGAAIEILLEPIDAGTRVTMSCQDWANTLGEGEELAGWFSGEVLAGLLLAVLPGRMGNWITDRRARRPSGKMARGMYRDPLYHYPNFKVILAELALRPDDDLLDVGCGGGALLREALKSGCRAAGIDHSAEMVRVATQENRQAVDEGRLVIRQASADRLPFGDAQFSRASMTGVLGFLPDPLAAFRELHRVLRAGGRLVVFGSDPSLRGTPAAPEPIASRLRFYDDAQLAQLAQNAGFADAKVVRRDLLPFASEVGIPEEHLPLFAGKGAPFLIAVKGS